ncbi:Galactoside O-acetyltransferase [compost metagenome]
MKVFIKGVLGSLASIIIWPSVLIALIHKIRGVKIKNITKVFIAYNVNIDNMTPELIQIGEDVKITRNVTILSHFHPTKAASEIYGELVKEKVIICDGVFIGVGAIVLPGVTIGYGAIVGAGAVVTKDVPPNCVVAGNPARVIKTK